MVLAIRDAGFLVKTTVSAIWYAGLLVRTTVFAIWDTVFLINNDAVFTFPTNVGNVGIVGSGPGAAE